MRIGVFMADGFEEIEALATVDLLKRAGLDVETISVTMDSEVVGSHGILTRTDFTVSECSMSFFDMIVLPGGPGHKNLEKCTKLINHIKWFNEDGKYIAAICASPSILGRAGVLEGRRATCFPGFEGELRGATYTGADAEWDHNIITGRSAGCTIPFALKIVEATKGHDAAAKLAKDICYDYFK